MATSHEPKSQYVELGPGSLLEEKYRLEELLGEGAAGRVWRAVHLRLGRAVAVKVPVTSGRDPAQQARRFLREARLAAMVSHACVARVTDFGSASEVQPFMVMDLLSGETLAERYVREPALGDDDLLRIVEGALSGLQAVHDAGIVHRDVKPGNVFLAQTPTGVVPKLTDFGVSRVSDDLAVEHGRRSVLTTRSGVFVGTPGYASPEQARGVPDVDARADVYGMGVLMYEGLTGRMPFESVAIGELIIRIVSETPTPAEALGVRAAVAAVIERAMRKERGERYQSASEMREAVRALL